MAGSADQPLSPESTAIAARPTTLGHLPQLDGIRALAICGVLLIHSWLFPRGHPILNRFAESGWIGVDLFFVLSGFLISRILLATKDHPRYFSNFYARRALRIFPLYYLVLAVAFLVLPAHWPDGALLHARSESVWYVLYLSNFAIAAAGWQLMLLDITWSLAIEEQFYLVWPALIRLMKNIVPFCLAVIVALPVIRLALYLLGVNWIWLFTMMPLRADSFAFGALLAVFYQSPRAGVLVKTAALTSVPVLGVLILSGHYERETSMFVNTLGYSLNALACAAVLGLALLTRAAGSLSWAPIAHIGKVSYGVYMLHPLCLLAVGTSVGRLGMTATEKSALNVVVVSTLSIALATLSYRFFEMPFLNLKRYFAR